MTNFFTRAVPIRDGINFDREPAERWVMARNIQVTRILKVIQLLELSSKGLGIRDLHARLVDAGFDCSPRTVYRDVEAIENAYFPIEREGEGEEARFKLASIATVTRNIRFSYDELIALYLTRQSLNMYRGNPIYEALNGFFDRLESLLGPRAHEGLEELRQYVYFRSKATWHTGVAQEILETVHRACAESQVLEAQYKSVSGPNSLKITDRRLGPETLFFADAGAYLIAKDLSDGKLKTFALSRMASATLTEEAYDSAGFSADEFLRGNIGVFGAGEIRSIELFIVEPIASYASERRWHESQQLTRSKEGVTLKMEVKLSDELVRWILGLGSCARVVGPSELVTLVAEEAEKLFKSHTIRKSA